MQALPVVPTARSAGHPKRLFRLASLTRKDKLGLSLETMISPAKPAPRPRFSFPDWAAGLRADDSLTPGLRESYRQTLSRFGEFCRQRQAVQVG